MSPTFRALLLGGAALACAGASSFAVAAETSADVAEANQVDRVVITGARTRTSAVTGLDMSLRETPQSVTLIDQERMRDFALTDVHQLLAQVTGVNVERVETDRTYYNSRGFNITNFQVDGIGLPLIWGIQFGELDTVLFERVEAVRGANSMMTGTGNPSATINYVRKRPTKTFQASVAAQYGSWNDYRLEADVSGPLNASGTLSGRLIYANEDKDSYLDHYHVNRNVYGGLLAWDATPKLTATVGWSMQDNRAQGVSWGALPLVYSDGTRIDYPRSASTSADWTHWNVRDQTAFAELAWRFDNDWQLKTIATFKRFEENAKLLYGYGNPDKTTGLGVYGMSGVYPAIYENYILDAYASGPVNLFGREHQLVIGGQTSRSHGYEYEDFSNDVIVYGPVSQWGGVQPAEPTYPGAYLAANQIDRLTRFYAAAHLNLTDKLKAVGGFNALWLETKGVAWGADATRDASEISPYFGVVYDLTANVSLYANYTDIFDPQSEMDVNRRRLDPAHGKSYEAGVKSEWLDKRLYLTAAVFSSRQANLAEYAGVFADGKSYYAGVDTKAEGYEIEATGALSDQWRVSLGWTDLSIKDDEGNATRLYMPRKTLKASTTYAIPSARNLTLGAQFRWQDDIEGADIVPVTQKAYGVVDLMAGVDVTEKVRATLNVKNATDKTYLGSLMWSQAYYAPPRSVSLRLDYAF